MFPDEESENLKKASRNYADSIQNMMLELKKEGWSIGGLYTEECTFDQKQYMEPDILDQALYPAGMGAFSDNMLPFPS